MKRKILGVLAIGLALGIVFFEARRLSFAQETGGVVLAIYEGPHWIDELKPEVLAKYLAEGKLSQAEVDSRYRPGDVVEVFDAARVPVGVKPAPGSHLCFVRLPGVSLPTAKVYESPLIDKDVLVKRRQYRVRVESPAFATLSASGDVTVTAAVLAANLEVKSLVLTP